MWRGESIDKEEFAERRQLKAALSEICRLVPEILINAGIITDVAKIILEYAQMDTCGIFAHIAINEHKEAHWNGSHVKDPGYGYIFQTNLELRDDLISVMVREFYDYEWFVPKNTSRKYNTVWKAFSASEVHNMMMCFNNAQFGNFIASKMQMWHWKGIEKNIIGRECLREMLRKAEIVRKKNKPIRIDKKIIRSFEKHARRIPLAPSAQV